MFGFRYRHFKRLALLPMVIVAALACTPFHGAETKELTSNRVFESSSPATVLVQADFSATATLPVPILRPDVDGQLQRVLGPRVARGEIAANSQAISDAIVEEITSNPDTYYRPGTTIASRKVRIGAQGSGFFISSDGYAVTSAHVVAPAETTVKAKLAQADVDDIIAEGDAVLASRELSNQQRERLHSWAQRYVLANLRVEGVTRSVYVVMGAARTGAAIETNGMLATVESSGQPTPGKDVAVIKVSGSGFPALTLGTDTAVNPGDKLYVIGYPGGSTFGSSDSSSGELQPTLTSGSATSRQTMPAGWSVLGTDAGMTHGNSGGPVLDRSGRVVGIATFGLVDEGSGAAVQGFNFIVPVGVINEFLGAAKTHLGGGELTQKYEMALDAYDQHRFKVALPLLRSVAATSSHEPYAQGLIASSEMAIGNGKDETPPAPVLFLEDVGNRLAVHFQLVVLAGALFVALVVIAAVLLLARRRRRHSPESIGPVALQPTL